MELLPHKMEVGLVKQATVVIEEYGDGSPDMSVNVPVVVFVGGVNQMDPVLLVILAYPV